MRVCVRVRRRDTAPDPAHTRRARCDTRGVSLVDRRQFCLTISVGGFRSSVTSADGPLSNDGQDEGGILQVACDENLLYVNYVRAACSRRVG
jgi:hypothetical protein